jgi:oligopeptide/dipeptide ABC transporter ATP-binding protein
MQAQIVNLLLDLQDRFGLSYLFIAHDLAVVRSIARRVAVMYAGSIVEQGPKAEIYRAPKHPYTQALLDAVPRPDPERQRKPTLAGEIPSILNPLPGCAFAMRCPLVTDRCRSERPMPREIAAGHRVACHLA